jgi:hypothetical protein
MVVVPTQHPGFVVPSRPGHAASRRPAARQSLTLQVPVLPQVPSLLRRELQHMPAVHAQPCRGVPSRQHDELRGVANFKPRMFCGMSGAEGGLTAHGQLSRLLMLGGVAVGQRRVLAVLPGVQLLVLGQMFPRHPRVITRAPMFDVCVFGCVPVTNRAGSRLFVAHDELLR